MRSKFYVLAVTVFVAGTLGLVKAPQAWATTDAEIVRKDFKNLTPPEANLIEESNSLRLNQEAAVQATPPPSNIYVSMLGGVSQPNGLLVESNGVSVQYNFPDAFPLATMGVSHYFINWHGKWGWAASIGYSYSQYSDGQNLTALHVIPVNANLAYRAEFTDTQKLVPYVMVGPESFIYVQRGTDNYNTSAALWTGAVTGGIAFNLDNIGLLNSRTNPELLLQYMRNVAPGSGATDLNGNTFQIGASFEL